MQQRDFDSFVDILQVVAEQYGKRLSDGLIALYWQGLKDYDFAAVRDALGRHIRNPDSGMFMPKIADVVKMLQGSTQDSALIAWAKVDKAVRQVGTYLDVVFDDPLIHRVIHDMGGWIALGTKTEDEWPFVAREFENRYRGFKARGEVPEYPSRLVGVAGSHNEREGFAAAMPVLIGNASAAQLVLEGGNNKPLVGITRMHAGEVLALEERRAA